jgi:hypothetical protein
MIVGKGGWFGMGAGVLGCRAWLCLVQVGEGMFWWVSYFSVGAFVDHEERHFWRLGFAYGT